MLTVVLVDDMKPALRELEYLLKKYPDIEITGMFTDPVTAIEKMPALKPQVVFLDIHMPQLQGMDAASQILDASPGTDIVFVTAFDQYAVEAFELQALDYILKPVDEQRLEKTMTRLREKALAQKEQEEKKLQIRCLGHFHVGWEGQEPMKWRTEKTKELFAYLLQHAGRGISKDELLDQLWPEDDPQKSIRQLYNGIYYIRKVLQNYGIGENHIAIGSHYHLQIGAVDMDVRYYDQFEKGDTTGGIEELEALEALYRGDYLEGEYYPWADMERERLGGLYVACLLRLSQEYLRQQQFAKAESKLMKAYRRNPYDERITELLLRLFTETGEKSKAVRHFHAYSKVMADELGIKPGQELVRLYQSITGG